MKPVSETSKYRTDIDGLRAIAVISVILFHLDKAILPGGFVGVDIFFVISGFLITKIIYNEMLAGKFSFLEFYKRRIKRIAPAFFVCVGVTLAIGLIIFIRGDIKPLARSVIASIFSFSNIYFYKVLDTSYFNNNSEETPLLHMWSLGVEEQFYLFWPLTLLILNKFFRKNLLLIILIAIIASFGYAEIMLYKDPKFAYYMIFTRSGEMFLGSILAVYLHKENNKRVPSQAYEIVSVLGLVLVIYSIIYTDNTNFPGISAFFPCIGTVMIIYAGSLESNCIVNKTLSIKPLVFIGLISYSLYLWHWPIITYFNYLYFNEIKHKVIVIILTILLSLISYYFIEVPIRRSNLSTSNVYIKLYIIPAVALTFICVSLFNPKVRDYVAPNPILIDKGGHPAIDYDAEKYKNHCFVVDTPDISLLQRKKCINGYNKSTEPNVFFMGDSHADHFVEFLNVLGEHYKFSFRSVCKGGCAPILGGDNTPIENIYGADPKDKSLCTAVRTLVKQHILNYKYVIFSTYITGNYPKQVFKDFEETIKWLTSHKLKVIILGTIPVFDGFKRRCLYFFQEDRFSHKFSNCTHSTFYDVKTIPHWNSFFKNLSHKYKDVYYMDVTDIICPNGLCSPYIDHMLSYADNNHLFYDASKKIGNIFIKKATPLPSIFTEIIESQK